MIKSVLRHLLSTSLAVISCVSVFMTIYRWLDGHAAVQAEKLRSRAQKQDVWRSTQQLCRYLFYLGRIRAVQLDYTDAKDCLQQAVRKARLSIRSKIVLLGYAPP